MESTTILTQKHISLLAEVTTKQKEKLIKKIMFIMLIVGIFIAVPGFIFSPEDSDMILPGIGIFLILFSLTYFPMFKFINKKLTTMNKANINTLKEENKAIIVYHDTFLISQGFTNGEKLSENKFAYDKLVKGVFYKDAIFLFITKTLAYIVLKDEMSNGSFNELIPLLKEAMKDKFQIFN